MPINPEDNMERSAPQTESARERGDRVDGVDDREYGAADHDPNGEGDIADEGPGHRDVEPAETRPTPGSAEGERDPADQSRSNIPRSAASDRH
jgi:hypothetical protein